MPRKRIKCPADYDDPMQSDSDHREDPSYSQEDENASLCPPSPQLSGGSSRQYRTRQRQQKKRGTPETTQREQNAPPSPTSPQVSGVSALFRKRQREKSNQSRQYTFEEAERILNDRRNRITTPTQQEDDDEISRPATDSLSSRHRKCHRKKPSVVWEHVTKSPTEDIVNCNHCAKKWEGLNGSTSNPLKHIKDDHYDKLTDEQKAKMSQNGETSGKGGTLPRRTLYKKLFQDGPLPRNHKAVKRVDAKLARVLISSIASWSLLDNAHFGAFCDEILSGRYNLPTRTYMLNNVINPMFQETKEHIRKELKKCKNIGLTTDAWTSIVQQSFITVTAHIIDDDFKLVSYVLDTQEIKERHTSENLLHHLHTVLKDYDIQVGDQHQITLNFNATNRNDIHEEDIESDEELNFLNTENDIHEVTINEDSQSQTQDLLLQLPDCMLDEHSQHSVHSTQSSNTDILCPHLTFTSDNASDICKAIKKIGQFVWFGCAGHHLNLIAQAGFKQVQAAAFLVKKCKRIVEHIRSSVPASYMLLKYQELLELPLHRVLQENNTRWWSILLMMQSLMENMNAITIVLGHNGKSHLILNYYEQNNINLLIKLLKPFKECGEKLSSETNVTISLIIPLFEKLKKHLTINAIDTTLIQNMKTKMLAKLKSRYSSDQMKILKTCTLLDIRNKSITYVANHYDQLEKDVTDIMGNQGQSQQVIPATQGQELQNLSSFDGNSSAEKSIFDYDDDVIDETQLIESDTVKIEIRHYRSLTMSAEVKDKCNLLDWWQNNKAKFPCLFKTAQAYLHIPATSVPSERIFSLAGYIVCDRRSKILATNVNKSIFLKRNEKHIPPETSIWSSSG